MVRNECLEFVVHHVNLIFEFVLYVCLDLSSTTTILKNKTFQIQIMEMDTNNIDAFITSYKKFAKDVKVLSEEYGLLKQWVDLILFQQQSIENNTNLKNYLTLFSRAADLVRMERQFLYDGEKGFLLILIVFVSLN